MKLMMMSWIRKLLIHIKVLLSILKGLPLEIMTSVVTNGTVMYVTFAQTENFSLLFFFIHLFYHMFYSFCFFFPTSSIHAVFFMCAANFYLRCSPQR